MTGLLQKAEEVKKCGGCYSFQETEVELKGPRVWDEGLKYKIRHGKCLLEGVEVVGKESACAFYKPRNKQLGSG